MYLIYHGKEAKESERSGPGCYRRQWYVSVRNLQTSRSGGILDEPLHVGAGWIVHEQPRRIGRTARFEHHDREETEEVMTWHH